MKSKLLGLMALVSLLGLSPASATTFDWSDFNGGGTFTASPDGDGEYTITAITGTYFSESIEPLTSPVGNDNLLFYPTTPQLDSSGFAFTTASVTWLIYYDSSTGFYMWEEIGLAGLIANYGLDAFLADPVPTPLPAALPLFGTGLGVLGVLGWRRKRKHAAATAA